MSGRRDTVNLLKSPKKNAFRNNNFSRSAIRNLFKFKICLAAIYISGSEFFAYLVGAFRSSGFAALAFKLTHKII